MLSGIPLNKQRNESKVNVISKGLMKKNDGVGEWYIFFT